jgi:hypothetical protein
MPWSKASKREFANKMIPPEERFRILFGPKGAMTRYAGATTKAFETATGKMDYGLNQMQNRLEDLGARWGELKGKIGDALTDLAVKLKSVVDKIADELTPKLIELLDWIDRKMPGVIRFFERWGEQITIASNALKLLNDSLGAKMSQFLDDAKVKSEDLGETMSRALYGDKRYEEMRAFWAAALNPDFSVMSKAWGDAWEKSLKDTSKQWNDFWSDFWKSQWPKYIDPAMAYLAKKLEETLGWLRKLFGIQGGGGPANLYQQGGGGGGGKTSYPATALAPSEPYTGENIGALKDVRARLVEEAEKNPQVMDKLMRVAQAEVGTSDPQRLQAFIEGVFNRAASRKQSLDRALQADYYETLRHGPLAAPSAAQIAKHKEAIAKVAAGSNISGYSTGNWSSALGRGFGAGGYLTKIFGREQFGVESADVKWARAMKAREKSPEKVAETVRRAEMVTDKITANAVKMIKEGKPLEHPWFKSATPRPFWGAQPQPKPLTFPKVSMEDAMMKDPRSQGLARKIRDINLQQRMGGATGGMNVAASPTINVHAASDEHGRAIAQSVSKALSANTDQLLAALRKAKSDEARLGYV